MILFRSATLAALALTSAVPLAAKAPALAPFDKGVVSAADPRAAEAGAEILRKGGSKTLSIALGEMPTEKDEVVASSKAPGKTEVNRLGLILRDLTPQQKKKINGKNGLLVVDSEPPAAQAGIRRGDIILGLNNTEVQGLEQFDKQLATVAAGKTVALLVLRDENTLYVPVKVGAAK